MNRVFRIIWSKALRTWVVASEFAASNGKGGGGADERGEAAMPVSRTNGASHWPMRIMALSVLLALYLPAQAADRYWDVNGSGVGLGGTGAWNTAPGFWSDSSDGVSGPFTNPWNNAAPGGDNAFFMGTAGTVTLAGPTTVHNLTFGTAGYTLTGGALTLVGAAPTIDTATGTTTINSTLAGVGGLTKAGTGTLALNGVNTFSGGLNITGGTLDVAGDSSLGAASNGIALSAGSTLVSTGALAASRVVTLSGATGIGGGVGSAHLTGAGGFSLAAHTTLTDNTNDFTGPVGTNGYNLSFTSIRNLGEASALGAATTAANGAVSVRNASATYIGSGDTSNRSWNMAPFTGSSALRNQGTGTLTVTGDITAGGGYGASVILDAQTADLALLGVISSNLDRPFVFIGGGTNRNITLNSANTFGGGVTIQAVTVRANSLADQGTASSLGTGAGVGTISLNNSVLSYIGTGSSSNRGLLINNSSSVLNDGTGALTLSGAVAFNAAAPADTFTLGGGFTGANTLSGVISGAGNLAMNGAGTWVLGGNNTYSGTTTVQNGTLTAGSAQAFGASTGLIVNGGTLDLNDLAITAPTLAGTGGTVDLGSGSLTVNAASGSTTYGGSIAGSGSLTKLGGSTLTLTGANTYTGATNIGAGTLALNFAGAGGPTSNIVSSASTLNMAGGTLTVTGAAGEANTQTFNDLNVTAGSNRLTTAPAAGGGVTVDVGTITRSGGLIDFGVSTTGIVTTDNADGTLGGWATVNGSDYAKVQGGSIIAFTAADYTDKDDAATWLDNEFISDSDGDALSFSGTVSGNKQLGGLQYTTAANSTVNVGAGQTLGIDGTIIVTSTVGNTTKIIQGGNLTGLSGGSTLGVLQNGGATSNFTIASTIIDNAGAIGFSKGGTGLVTLTGANTYTGATTLSGGTLSINSVANAGTASSIGASSNASSNLVIENGTLSYTGGSASTDRGFTLVNGGPSRTIEVTNGVTNLAFNGLVISPDDAGFTKTGAGTLTLGNTGNNYVGATTVSAGTLSVGALANGGLASGIGAASSDSANLVINTGANLEYTGGTAASDRGFTLGTGVAGGGIDVDSAPTTLTMSGVATGAGALRKEGAGTLVLSGTNTYTGGTIINAGVLRAGSATAFGSTTGLMTVNAGGALQLGTFNTTVGALSGAGLVDVGTAMLTMGGVNGTFTGAISGTGGLTRTGGGAQTFTGCNNSYTGATTINGGVISTNCLANGLSASGIGASSNASSNLMLANNGVLQYTGASVAIDRGINLAGGWGYIDVTNGGTTLSFGGTVTGGGGLVKRDQGTLVLSGPNTYTGGTAVQAGILRAGSTTAFGTGGMTLSNVAGATLDLANNNSSVLNLQGGGALGGNIALGSATLTVTNGSNLTYSGAISGTGGVRKSGGPGAVQVLAGCASSYAGSTVIDSGGIAVSCLGNGGSNSSIGASSAAASNLVLNGGYLQYLGAGNSTDRQFTLGGSVSLYSSGTGAIAFTSAAAVAQAGTANAPRTLTLRGANTGNNILAAQLTNNGTGATSLTKDDGGTWILTNSDSTYTGITTINGGVLGVDKLSNGGVASSIGASSAAAANLVIGNGSTLRYTGAGDTTNRLFTLSAGTSFIESSGTGAVVFTDTGPVTLQTNNVARTIALGGTNTGNNTLAGSIGNAGTGVTTLAKNDSGTWVLTGNNTFTGNTVINDGNLIIGNGGTTGNAGAGNVIVNAPTSTLSINRSDAFNFNGTLSGPGTLAQIGTGTTVLTSTGNSIGATTISAGTLEVNGALTTSTIAMTGTSALTVNGTVQAAGGTASTITGDVGASTINLNGTLLANGNLGGGSDVVNVAGTLNTSAGVLNLGDGDDTLSLVDGGVISGAGVDGGLGAGDILQVNNAAPRTISGALFAGFERLIKQGLGILTATGNHTFSAGTDLAGGTLDVDGSVTTPTVTMADGTTLNVDGTLQAAGGTAATLTGSAGVNTVLVNTGATLRANGDLGGGNDVVTLASTLDTGAAALALGSGDDTVTLNDGASLAGVGINAGAQTTNDVLILNNALGLTFDGSRTAGFESLIKQNSGTATMTGTQSFTAGTALNGGVLDIDGSLTTPTVAMAGGTTLNVDGALHGTGGTAAQVTGGAGVETINIAGTATATGDLGGGNDVLDVTGTLDTDGGVFALGDGDDSFVVHDGTNVIGTIDGGAGLDSRVYNINGVADLGALVNFEGITKTGTGTLNLNGPGTTDLQEVEVLGGTLDIGAAGSLTGVQNAIVASGATLNVDGVFGFTTGADSFTVAGTVTGASTIDMLDGNDTFTLQDGADLSGLNGPVDGGAGTDALVADLAGTATLGGAVNFETLDKTNTGTLIVAGPAPSSFTTVNVAGGTLDIDAAGAINGVVTGTVASGSTLNVDGSYTGSTGNDSLTVAGAVTGNGSIAFGNGDDTLTLNEGADLSAFNGTLDGGAHGAGDRVALNNATAMTLNVANLVNFEFLQKDNIGEATLTGNTAFSGGTLLNGGTLTVAGGLTTPTLAMAGGTTLNVDGTLQGAGGTAAQITGGAGVETINIAGTATATGDLGGGNDVLDVTGTLDTDGGVFALGDGNDSFIVHDGSNVIGTIDGGAGLDSRVYNINGSANLGALVNFEGVTKTGTGTLNIDGPVPTDLQDVQVLGGTLDIGPAGSVIASVGSALNTVVGSGATLNVDGSYGCGAQADTMTVSGTVSGTGTINLCGGDDTLTLNDGAVLTNVIDGDAGTADTVVLNNAGAMTFNGANTVNFEVLQKDNVGEATLTGVAAYTGGTLLNGGTLNVAGGLTTPTLAMAGGTTLNVNGTLQGAGGTAAAITGGAGVETINIAGTATATGDLGGGNDVLDVTGTLDTDGGVFALGDGDDSFVVHDGTVVNGTIDGGAGLDSRVYNINGVADLGALLNFEGVTKTGTGTLNLNGPGATDLQDVQVLGGTLNVGAGASVVATAGSALNTVVGSGATLNVDGSYGCGAQADTMTVSGTVSGSGTINLCGGDDTLTLNDGAVLANVIDGDAGTADTVVLNNTGAMTFNGANTVNFEILQKDNVGEATLTGVATYTGGALLNGGTLTVDGSLTTPTLAMGDGTTLNVDGALQGVGGTAATITGSAGTNIVSVSAGATLTATGDLGDGSDVLDAAGTIDTDGGVLSLGAGDDTFNVYDTTDTSLATIDGGAGNDLLDVTVGSGNTVPLGGLLGFESLGKSGLGTLEIHGASDFIDVALNGGTLRVTDTGSVSAANTTILAGATLELADGGSYSGTAGDDTFTVAGSVVSTGSNTGSLDLGGGNDTFTIQDGADLSGLAQPVSGGAGTDNFVADLAGTATLGGAIDFETLTKTNTGTLIVAGPATSSFATVNVDGGILDIGAAGSLTGVQNATVASGATLNVDGVFGFTAGADSFTVAGTVTGTSTIDMLDGDDTFTIQDGADLSGLNGPVDGGAGNDTFVSDLAGTATLGGALNFETLNKTNTGTLIVAGPAASAFTTVNVAGGTLDVGVNGALDGVVTGTVASGATLNVDGRYTGSAGIDTLTVAGIVSGSGDIALGDGDDTLTLNDGADLSGLGGLLDGGAHSGGDRVVLNNATAMNFSAGNLVNFEFLQKDNLGEATLGGTMAFTGGTVLNGGTLTVAGDLTTSTVSMADDTALNVDGALQGTGSTAAVITGSAGVNTVTVTGTALASGDLGAGDDVLDVTGTLDTDGGAFGLGDGDDDFVVHDGTVVNGTIDGGAGLDSRVYDINGMAEFGALLNFEGVTKRGAGTLNISGPGATDLQSVEVEGGTLNVGAAASVVATAGSALNTVVASGATLNVDGSFGCGDNADTMTVAGTVSGSGAVAMCGGDDTLTLQDGATLANLIDGGADIDTVVLDNASAMSFDGGNTINFEVLQKDNIGAATLTGNATYTGGALLNGGTLTVTGSLTAPTVAMADGTVFNVNGALQGTGGTAAALTGSAGVNTVNIAGTALANGDLGGGNDVVDVTGTLNTGSGVFALGDGDDTLTIHDGTNIVGTVVAGTGNDTFNTDIATNADLGAVQGFETLSKTGIGTLDINGPMSSDFTTVNVLAGTVNVAAGGSVVAQNTTVAAGSTLQIAGSYSGTAGDDSFTSMGTVRGALTFGAGADTARFVGGDVSGLTSLDGGAGSDLLSFSGLQLQAASLPTLAGWERMELLNNSALTLGGAFNLSGGVLAIDATSTLFANAGASLNGSIENAGLIDVGLNRLAIGGGYTSNAGALQLTVSPGTSTSGGLSITGDVVGTTRVVFNSDGSSPAADAPASILVISSPNDNTATAGGFVPTDSPDGFVRLEGSLNPWTFGQQADNNWYLSAETASLLPEISGYAVLPSLGTLLSRQSSDLVHQRLAGVRSTERPQCGGQGVGQSGNASAAVIDDCHGLWVATTASELELGANPGFEVSGDDVGLYVGIDGDLERDNRTIRAGGYVGFTHGVYWTTGASSTELAGTGPARIDIDSPVVGMYANTEWHNGNYLDLVLSGHRPGADIRTADGFTQRVTGNSLTLSARIGRSYELDNGWKLEPQVQLTASQMHWADTIDAAGRELVIDDDLAGAARAALRVEKAFTTAGGALIKPWVMVGVQNVVGEKENGMYLGTPGSMDAAQAFPGHDLGTSANLDLGVEAGVNQNFSLFGVISVGQDIDGSDLEQRSANLGLRVRW